MKIDFKHKGFTILISVFFAFIFWAFVMADSNTTRFSDIRNVSINFRGLDGLSEKGMVITDRSKESCTVRIEGPVNIVDYINANNINSYVDLSSINEPGEHELVVNTFSNNGSVVVRSVSPARIKVNVEEYVDKQVPVEIAYDSEIPENYWIREAKVQSGRVTIAGGQSIVQKVSRAVINVNTQRLIEAYEENPGHVYESSIPLVYVDENNNEVTGINSQSSIVSIDVLSKKTVKVDVQGAIEGNPAPGYSVGSIEQSAYEVDIVGKKDVLDKITTLRVDSINITGTKKNVVSDVGIKPIDGVTLVGSDIVKVSVNIINDAED